MWLETGGLEWVGGRRNGSCSGEMHRYDPEPRLRRQATRTTIDTEAREHGERTGLDTLVVHAVNDDYWLCAC